MMEPAYSVSVPGRICFAGEDIDWMSGFSILGAIDLRIKSDVIRADPASDCIEIESSAPVNSKDKYNFAEGYSPDNSDLRYPLAAIKRLSESGYQINPVKMKITSQLPARAGLSSSAAVTLASLAGLNASHNLKLTRNEICKLAYKVESEDLKTLVGQMDFYSCCFGGIICLDSTHTPPSSMELFNPPREVQIIIIDTLTPRNTKDVIKEKRKRFQKGESTILKYKELTEAAVSEMYLELKGSNDVEKIGRLITRCHRYLDKFMGVSTKLMNELVEICIKGGSYGAKLTGTGMGGCVFAICAPSKTNTILKLLDRMPVKVYVTNINRTGLQYLHTQTH